MLVGFPPEKKVQFNKKRISKSELIPNTFGSALTPLQVLKLWALLNMEWELCVCRKNASVSTNRQQNIFIILYIDLLNYDGNRSANKVV